MFNIYGKYTDATVYADICEAEAMSQIYDLCNHPIFAGASIKIMPDVHAGKGCTVGTTVKMKGGALIPSIIGADIGCGVLTVIFTADGLDLPSLEAFISENIPFGMAVRESTHRMMNNDVKRRVRASAERLGMTKSEQIFLRSCGTLGGGNHYIEIGVMKNGKYALTIHTGSRSFGKCVAEYYGDRANNYLHSNNITGVNRSLPFVENEDYFGYLSAMECAMLFARENRRLIAHDIITQLGVKPELTFDTMHNFVELHRDGSITVRKGAISAKEGETVAIPMNMRDGVLICRGKGNPDWNESAPHGAGRLMSRADAKASISLDEYQESMKDVFTCSVLPSTIDESPMAYKPAAAIIELVADTVDILDIARPVYNFKARSISGK